MLSKSVGCSVVNMDTAPLFTSCKKLNMNYGYVATVTDFIDTTDTTDTPDIIDTTNTTNTTDTTDIIDITWSNNLTKSVNLGNDSQNDLVEFIVQTIPKIHDLMISKYEDKCSNISSQVEKFFNEINICKSHNIEHINRVVEHTIRALEHETTITNRIKFLIKIAALTHDVDDIKFTTTNSYSNARGILSNVGFCQEDIDLVVEMISYVSSTENGDTIPDRAKIFPWLLIPRHVDRLDAMGINGVIRCYQYTKTKNRPLYNTNTPKPSCIDNVWNIATVERYGKYNGNSLSMIDHYYDKLLQLGNFPTNNPYVKSIKDKALKPLLEIINVFINDKLTDNYFELMISSNK